METYHNPFEAPWRPEVIQDEPTPPVPASVASRVLGWATDLAGLGAACALASPLGLALARPGSDQGAAFAILIGGSAWGVAQAGLVTWRGQSVGKMVFRTRIVLEDGAPAGFVRGVLLRSWLWTALTMTPLLGTFLWIGDLITLSQPERRTLHDRLAQTRVITTTW